MTNVAPIDEDGGLLTIDYLGNECIKEDDLDAAYMTIQSKGIRLPMTCLNEEDGLNRELLTEAIGRPPTQEEWASNYYRKNCLGENACFVPLDDLPGGSAAVPIPAIGPVMALALVGAMVWKKFSR